LHRSANLPSIVAAAAASPPEPSPMAPVPELDGFAAPSTFMPTRPKHCCRSPQNPDSNQIPPAAGGRAGGEAARVPAWRVRRRSDEKERVEAAAFGMRAKQKTQSCRCARADFLYRGYLARQNSSTASLTARWASPPRREPDDTWRGGVGPFWRERRGDGGKFGWESDEVGSRVIRGWGPHGRLGLLRCAARSVREKK
jgi:hypothetical protein